MFTSELGTTSSYLIMPCRCVPSLAPSSTDKALDGHKNYDDPDFLDAAFYFYDENAEIVRVTVAESLDSDLLNYRYQQVENPWIPSEAVSSRQVSSAPILHTQPQNSNLVSQS